MKRVVKVLLWTLLVLLLTAYFFFILPVWGVPFNGQRHGNPPLTPSWALECWLWEDDVNTSDYVDELLAGYRAHDIPVRTILLDSPWSMRYNDFEIDTVRYKQPRAWFKKLEEDGYRVVLWMTSMVNIRNDDTEIKEDSDWYGQAAEREYLARPTEPLGWWKGDGGFIDYTDSKAMEWWRGLQQNVFDLGIDGWKLDGTATLFRQQWGPVPIFYKGTAAGIMSTRTYMDHYYRDEYRHGLTQNPDFVTLSRAIDRGYHPEGFAPIDASPVNWVGDQRHEWVTDEMIRQADDSDKDVALHGIQGFESAIKSILKSARLGYNIVGSDIGGFSGSTIPPRLYIRWAQFSAFCGLFLNGGHGERRLWKRTPRELDIIRKYAWLHTELVPYMYHYVLSAHKGGRRLQIPLKEGKYHYMFGDDFLVAPIYMDSKTRKVSLPEGKWRYFFGDSEVLEGPRTLERDYELEEFPVYIREGAIVPLNVKRSYTGLGNETSMGFVTFLIYPDREHDFSYYDPDTSQETRVSYINERGTLKIKFEGEGIPHILRVHSQKKPVDVIGDGEKLQPSTWSYDANLHKIMIKPNPEEGYRNYTVQF